MRILAYEKGGEVSLRCTIGIPASLGYFSFFPFWATFFEKLGCKVVVSGDTTKQILDWGVAETVSDACIPIKVYHGHVVSLIDRCDYLFVPRLVSLNRMVTFCPKFLGLPDMIRHTVQNLPPLLEVVIDWKQGWSFNWQQWQRAGQILGFNSHSIAAAYWHAARSQASFEHRMLTLPPSAVVPVLKGQHHETPPGGKLNIAVLGYPYQIYDQYVSVGLLHKLSSLGAEIWTMERVPSRTLTQCYPRYFPKRLFWYFSDKVIRASIFYLNQPWLDGIIHITAFGCGPDAMVDKLMELEAQKRNTIPFMSVAIDEHTGEAGMLTRLEAFVDMIRFRRAAG